jgi:hypothetical protein
MDMAITAESVKQFALENGASLVGVAPVERFGGAPTGHHPADILPGTKSVVVCAQPIPAGVFDGPATSYQVAMDAVHLALDRLATLVALFLEEDHAPVRQSGASGVGGDRRRAGPRPGDGLGAMPRGVHPLYARLSRRGHR